MERKRGEHREEQSMIEDIQEKSGRVADGEDAEASTLQRLLPGLSEPMGTGQQKLLLPRGSAETRFAPPQYYYLASKSGVVPSWAVAEEARH
jgi:hypothetical protein